jgi:hypothetical protein
MANEILLVTENATLAGENASLLAVTIVENVSAVLGNATAGSTADATAIADVLQNAVQNTTDVLQNATDVLQNATAALQNATCAALTDYLPDVPMPSSDVVWMAVIFALLLVVHHTIRLCSRRKYVVQATLDDATQSMLEQEQ